MRRIAWSRLMHLGFVHLRLSPDLFWSLTPAELMLMAGGGVGHEALSRAALAELEARFPDSPRKMTMELE